VAGHRGFPLSAPIEGRGRGCAGRRGMAREGDGEGFESRPAGRAVAIGWPPGSTDESATVLARCRWNVLRTERMLGRMAESRDADWVSWPEAAAIVGCPVPTIDWYTRTGRIRKRPRHGARPSLSRSSVEDFARWWRQVQTARADRRLARRSRAPATPRRRGERRRARDDGLPPGLPDQGVWMTVTQAADLLEVSPATVVRLARSGSCPSVLHCGRWWVDRKAVADVAEDRRDGSRSWRRADSPAVQPTWSATPYDVAGLGNARLRTVRCLLWNAHRCWSSPRDGQRERGPGRGAGRPVPRGRSALLRAAVFGSIPGRPRWCSGSA
jgi:hypothetical protein